MTLTVNLTEADYHEWNAHHRRIAPEWKHARLAQWKRCVVGFGIHTFASGTTAAVMIGCLKYHHYHWLPGFIGGGLLNVFLQSQREWRWKYKTSPQQKESLGDWQYRVENGGISVRRNGGERHYAAAGIGVVTTTKTLTLIPVSNTVALPIPHQRVPRGEYIAFMEDLAALFAASDKSPATVLRTVKPQSVPEPACIAGHHS